MLFPSFGSPSSIKEVPALTIVERRLRVIEELTMALLPLGISKPIFPGTFPDFSGGTSGKEPGCQCRRHKRCGFDPRVRKIPWRREWQPTPVLLPGKFHGWRSLVGYSPWDRKELETTEQLHWFTSFQSLFIFLFLFLFFANSMSRLSLALCMLIMYQSLLCDFKNIV